MKLDSDVKYVKGVGPKRADVLKKLDIYSIEDLFFYFPKKYQDRRVIKEKFKLDESLFDTVDVFYGEVVDFFETYTSTSLRIFKILIKNEDKVLEAVIFKNSSRHYDVFSSIKSKISKGIKMYVVGKIEPDFFKPRMNVDEFYFEDDEININRIVPVYSLTSNLDNKTFRKIVFNAINDKLTLISEILPDYIIEKRNLLKRDVAVKQIHFPDEINVLEKARKRFIYEELFLMSVAWSIKKRQTKLVRKRFKYEIKKNLLTPFKNNMGFEFTSSQKKAINEIFRDMMNPYPMTRLLQGDVGSGKTVVAISAALLAVENGYQCAFMAPTEILAEQHYIRFKRFLKDLPVKFEIITSSTAKKKKKEIIEKTARGEIDILIGTHSIIEKDVKFKNLSLVIIDEQHRFGVRQRASLRQKGENVDILVMTATPIPRTLFLTLYGDLELSLINEMPKGRKKIKTFHSTEQEAFEKAKEELKHKRQVYIVFPLIDESDKIEVKALVSEFERIKKEFEGYNVDMIYGKMKTLEKQKVMEKFVKGEIDVLCCTQVIEVGIDVPNATVIIIENAERFGLASLHQLRGRVGRGEFESYCYLISDAKSGDVYERIKAMCGTTNGFELSETDAYIRGMGEILGTKQHGDMEFKIASIYRDKNILKEVFEDRDEIIKKDPQLLSPEHYILRKEIFELYGKKWNIIDLN